MSPAKKSIGKVILIFFALIILVSAVSAVLLYNYYMNSINNPMAGSGSAKVIEMTINKGTSPTQISEQLLSEGLIKDSTMFKIYLKYSKLDGKIKAGNYEFNTGMTVIQLVDKMVKGDVKRDTVKITIPEGYEIKEIAAAFEKAGIVKKEAFLEASQKSYPEYDFLKNLPNRTVKLEGYLFPDTYEFARDVTAEQIVRKMLDRFGDVFDSNMRKKAAEMKLSVDQVITMASIVEREAKLANERNLVSAVFYNRIKKSMRLESCATVQYALGERKEKLLYADLEIKSPYNTYRNDGLPIGPIANPGKASIDAALNPANVNYLFFVAKEDGSGAHAFTITYDEFLKEKHSN